MTEYRVREQIRNATLIRRRVVDQTWNNADGGVFVRVDARVSQWDWPIQSDLLATLLEETEP